MSVEGDAEPREAAVEEPVEERAAASETDSESEPSPSQAAAEDDEASRREKSRATKKLRRYAERGKLRRLKRLLKKHAGLQEGWVNKAGKDGRTALHLAARSGLMDTVALLLSHGAATGENDREGNTAAHFAAALVASNPDVRYTIFFFFISVNFGDFSTNILQNYCIS